MLIIEGKLSDGLEVNGFFVWSKGMKKIGWDVDSPKLLKWPVEPHWSQEFQWYMNIII